MTDGSTLQRAGVEQVNQAINQMYEVTQQNVALVEEAAAAADLMEEQARQLAQVVGTFQAGQESAPALAETVQQATPVAKRPVSPERLTKVLAHPAVFGAKAARKHPAVTETDGWESL